MGFNLGKALGINKIIGDGVGKLIGGGLGSLVGGPIGGLIGNKITSQLFGGGGNPANAPQNTNYGLLNTSAHQQQRLGADTAMKYMGLLDGAVQNRARSINAGYGNDEQGRMALGQAQTGADAAFRQGSSNLQLNLARRGLSGGVQAGGLSNLASQRAATMAGAYNNVARDKIARNIEGQRELIQMYGQQQNLGNLLRQQAEEQLLGLGNLEAQRRGKGQELVGDLIGTLASQYGQSNKKNTSTGGANTGSSNPASGVRLQVDQPRVLTNYNQPRGLFLKG